MTTEITRRQAIMLIVLGVVLVLVIYVQALVRPALSTISETKDQIETLEEEYNSLVQQSQSYELNLEALEGWISSNEMETRRLYPLGDAWRVDRFLSIVIRECGVTIDGLVISDAQEYFIDGEGNLVPADPDLLEESAETAAATGSEDTTAGYTATGEYREDFTYTMQGDYESMVQLLNFIDNLSFLGLSSYNYQSVEVVNYSEDGEEEDSGVQDWYSFTITITAYMYSDPLASDEEAETDTAEESEAVMNS